LTGVRSRSVKYYVVRQHDTLTWPLTIKKQDNDVVSVQHEF